MALPSNFPSCSLLFFLPPSQPCPRFSCFWRHGGAAAAVWVTNCACKGVERRRKRGEGKLDTREPPFPSQLELPKREGSVSAKNLHQIPSRHHVGEVDRGGEEKGRKELELEGGGGEVYIESFFSPCSFQLSGFYKMRSRSPSFIFPLSYLGNRVTESSFYSSSLYSSSSSFSALRVLPPSDGSFRARPRKRKKTEDEDEK